jgi:hypothetical protein
LELITEIEENCRAIAELNHKLRADFPKDKIKLLNSLQEITQYRECREKIRNLSKEFESENRPTPQRTIIIETELIGLIKIQENLEK